MYQDRALLCKNNGVSCFYQTGDIAVFLLQALAHDPQRGGEKEWEKEEVIVHADGNSCSQVNTWSQKGN